MRNCSQKVGMFIALTGVATAAFGQGETKIIKSVEVRTSRIPAGIHYDLTRTVRPGRIVKADTGQDGILKRTFEITYANDQPVAKKFISQNRVEAKPTRFLMGMGGYGPSRGAFVRARVMEMSATGYDPGVQSNGPNAGRTRTGMRATYGTVAVDPRVIPLNTLVFVEGYGFAIASDTGSAIKGNKIDLCFDRRSVAMNFGRKNVKVHILRNR